MIVHRPHAPPPEDEEDGGYIEEGCSSSGQHLDCCCGSRVMTHVIKVVKEKKMEKACWKTDENLFVRANPILLDKEPSF